MRARAFGRFVAHPDVVAKRSGPDGRFWIVEAVDPGLLEEADFFTLGIWRGEPAEGLTACSIAGFAGQNKTVAKHLGQELRVEVTGQDLSGYTITVPTGFDWSPSWNASNQHGGRLTDKNKIPYRPRRLAPEPQHVAVCQNSSLQKQTAAHPHIPAREIPVAPGVLRAPSRPFAERRFSPRIE